MSNRKAGTAADTDAMLRRLDTFLDERAEEHRRVMQQVIEWLEASGTFEHEIRTSVASIGVLFQKWSFEILFLLRLRGTMRFNQLKEELTSVGQPTIGKRIEDLTGVGSRTLSKRLKELEVMGLVARQAYAEVPIRVDYKLTPRGMRFGDLIMPVIAHLRLTEPKASS